MPTASEPVDVLVPRAARIGPSAGLRIHHGKFDPGDALDRAGLRVTSPARTCWDLAQWLDVVETVVVLDSMLARRLTDVPTLREYALSRAGRRGWRSLLRAVDLADAGAESPQESRTRVRLVLAGLPRPETQWVVADKGRFVARLDLAWPQFKVAVEYDGLWHDDPEQFHRDRQRLNRLLGCGWIVLHVTAKRLRDDFDGFVAEVRAALRARSCSPR
ncbi:endonuclease domain-containing protein [Micromonospora sp. NPDC048935]|uniref:endonuclease domain-containing protein n=1 Tax=Micromonospora sp. NPDC048935 TaxID=3364262 RepID=UPI0037139246